MYILYVDKHDIFYNTKETTAFTCFGQKFKSKKKSEPKMMHTHIDICVWETPCFYLLLQ